MTEVEFFFDFSSPWNYLGFLRLREAAMRQAGRIVWRPLDPRRLPEPAGAAPLSAARERYRRKDLADWAHFCGVRLAPSAFEAVPAADGALDAAAALAGDAAMPAFLDAAFRRLFEEGEGLPDERAVVLLAPRIGPLPADFASRLGRPPNRARLGANADDLVRRGGFATPSVMVGDDLYWGSDRMPLVELALQQRNEFRIVAPGAHGQPRGTSGAGK